MKNRLRWFVLSMTLMGQLCVGRWVTSQDPQLVDRAGQSHLRDDSFETKMKLLEAAWQKGDYDLARSLTHSLRDTLIQTQKEKQSPPPSLVGSDRSYPIETLPPNWKKWAAGWKYFKSIAVSETKGIERHSEPLEIKLCFPSQDVKSLAREIRVALVKGDQLEEVPCQTFGEVRRNGQLHCKVLMLLDSPANVKLNYLVFFGNPDAEFPQYPSDLITQGEGVGLDISNSHFKASLSRQTGQLERLTYRREHGLELFAGGEGHGEPPGIDWAHDYVDADNFQKLRITLWDRCPDYEVIHGPLCTIVRRWGFPHSPVHPIYAPSRLEIEVEYRFYAGLAWFHKMGSMRAIQDFSAAALRDDEWVFSGQSFTDKLWMGNDGRLREGDVAPDQMASLAGVGFYHKESKDAFIALFLEHTAEGFYGLEPKHNGAPMMYYRWHGNVWSRYPLPVKNVPSGATLRQKNAYVTMPYSKSDGPAVIELLRNGLLNPLTVAASEFTPPKQPAANGEMAKTKLARPGESGDSVIDKRLIWDALLDCKDAQLYTADINVVDMGLVYDLRVRGNVVTIVMTMPHRGRPRLGYFVDGSISVHPSLSVPIRERIMKIAGVKQVVVEQTWSPEWSSNYLTDIGRKKLGLAPSN